MQTETKSIHTNRRFFYRIDLLDIVTKEEIEEWKAEQK